METTLMPARRVLPVMVNDAKPIMNLEGLAQTCGRTREWALKWSTRDQLDAWVMNEEGNGWVKRSEVGKRARQPVFFTRLAPEGGTDLESLEVPCYNVKGAAQALDIHPVRIRLLIEKGQLPAYVIAEHGIGWVKWEPGQKQRDFYFLEEDIRAFERSLGLRDEAGQPLYRVPAVAQALGLTRSYIWQLIDRGQIQVVNVTRQGLKRREGVRISLEEFNRLKEQYGKSAGRDQ